MKVLLLKNYAPDRQFSMLAYAQMLERALPKSGCEVATVTPPVFFGRGRNTASGLGKWMGYLDKYILAWAKTRKAVKEFQPDIVHICDHSNAMYLPLFSKFPSVLCCHDLLAIKVWLGEIPGQCKSRTGGLQQQWIFSGIKKAPAILCVSSKTHDDLRRLAPDISADTRVIPMGLNYPFQRIDEAEADRRIVESREIKSLSGNAISGNWVLHVGNDSWYKNRAGALNIFRAASECSEHNLNMLFVGEPPSEEMLRNAHGLENSIAFIQDVSNELLEALYRKAICLLFPSLAEGYGWPPIEAQACGCPIVVSDIEPLRSNCKDALFIDPKAEALAGRQLAELLADEPRLEQLSTDGLKNAERFTAEQMIAHYYKFYCDIISANR
ncbi:glycosyltransferase family 4 protein [Cerasicoccus arenae]|uniref:Glycosyltransferase family 1 protein n=1 Tax=Cerasicoccus arenae TaxID=424488 RepID=A0A8J3D8H4_9BACT|nr:glycosyltransferase family 1 protein [Cerasicoccus arenae]MBK1857484.1 glycosyltransferase family 4 protein [Cerasicoccus arenae]GHB95295.1 hypothetical protein GCM10007047_08740 [Cerasicoccus arenae]